MVDNHSLNYHEHYPDGYSSGDEYKITRLKLEKWYRAFPKVSLCQGNHDLLPARRAISHGISEHYIKDYRALWGLPEGWEYEYSYYYLGLKIFHGMGYSGKYPHAQAVDANRMSVVIGHMHSVAGVYWTASDVDCVFGMAVGSGIDRKTYAFNYGRDFKRKPILSCGVILDNGEDPFVVRMKL